MTKRTEALAKAKAQQENPTKPKSQPKKPANKAPLTAKTTNAKAKEQALAKAKEQALAKAKEQALAKAKEQALAKAKEQALAKAKDQARAKALDPNSITVGEARRAVAANQPATPVQSPAASIKIGNRAIEDAKHKIPFLFALRVALHTRLIEQQKNNPIFDIPNKALFEDTSNNNYRVSKKDGETIHGCDIKMDNETATFDLLSKNAESIKALGMSVTAYSGAYEEWRTRCGYQNDNMYAPILELTVYDKKDIQPILDALKDLNVSKIKVLDPKDQKVIEEIKGAADIAQYKTPKP